MTMKAEVVSSPNPNLEKSPVENGYAPASSQALAKPSDPVKVDSESKPAVDEMRFGKEEPASPTAAAAAEDSTPATTTKP